ncbi:hypothetical protein KCU99_g366, partial [Aureobasidium melanogenum]
MLLLSFDCTNKIEWVSKNLPLRLLANPTRPNSPSRAIRIQIYVTVVRKKSSRMDNIHPPAESVAKDSMARKMQRINTNAERLCTVATMAIKSSSMTACKTSAILIRVNPDCFCEASSLLVATRLAPAPVNPSTAAPR